MQKLLLEKLFILWSKSNKQIPLNDVINNFSIVEISALKDLLSFFLQKDEAQTKSLTKEDLELLNSISLFIAFVFYLDTNIKIYDFSTQDIATGFFSKKLNLYQQRFLIPICYHLLECTEVYIGKNSNLLTLNAPFTFEDNIDFTIIKPPKKGRNKKIELILPDDELRNTFSSFKDLI